MSLASGLSWCVLARWNRGAAKGPQTGARAERTQIQTPSAMPKKQKKQKKLVNDSDNDEPQDAEPEEAVPQVQLDESSDEEPEVPDSDDEDEGEEEDDEEKKLERAAKRKRRQRLVAKRKGYRAIASKGGFSSGFASAHAERDVTANILTINETLRAAKWCPKMPNASTYGGDMAEFKLRTKLSVESLPRGPAAVLRSSGEVLARRIMNDAVQRTFDAGKTRVSVSTMMAALRPLQPVLNLSFMAPVGLIRHAQTTIVGNEQNAAPALGVLEHDDGQIKAEAVVLPKQVELAKSMEKSVKDRKVARAKRLAEAKATREAKSAKEIEA